MATINYKKKQFTCNKNIPFSMQISHTKQKNTHYQLKNCRYVHDDIVIENDKNVSDVTTN